MRGLLRTAYVRRITVQYLTVLLYDGNAEGALFGDAADEGVVTSMLLYGVG
jgi:hypothetical protein